MPPIFLRPAVDVVGGESSDIYLHRRLASSSAGHDASSADSFDLSDAGTAYSISDAADGWQSCERLGERGRAGVIR